MKGGGGNYDHHQIHHLHHHHSFKSTSKQSSSSSSSSYSLFPKLMVYLLLLLCFIYFLYTVSLFSSPSSNSKCPTSTISTNITTHISLLNRSTSASTFLNPKPKPLPLIPRPSHPPTSLSHIVFGIAASATLWDKRRDYLRIWYRPDQMRGFVWLDKPIEDLTSPLPSLPTIKISADTSNFRYTHRQGHRSAIRISRIVSETFRLHLPDVHWYVMGDDDTVFLTDNLVRVLSQFDHNQPYYIGSSSESHLQNIYFSYGMAYGGGGFAISRPLAAAISKMQDGCLQRYPALYGSDDRIQACMAELGVPLTKHAGFHQYDVYGDLLGLLAAHPVVPLVSLHHLDVVQPIFPKMGRAEAVKKLFDGPVKMDSAGVMQQSICYDTHNRWTVSVSWGFVVQVVRGIMSPREMEMPARTFLNWYRKADYTAYAFNTRPVARNPCQKPFVYYLSSSRFDTRSGKTVTVYNRKKESHPTCKWKMADPAELVDEIVVYKKPDPVLWDRSPRRNCCRVMRSKKEGMKTMGIDVGVCREGEVSQT